MKWVKVAIGAVIAIAVVPMIVTSIRYISEPTTEYIEYSGEYDVAFTINYDGGIYNIDDGTFNLLYLLTNEGDDINLVNVTRNDVNVPIEEFTYITGQNYNNFGFTDSNYEYIFEIKDDDTLGGYPTLQNDQWVFTFDVENILIPITEPPSLSPTIITLLSLIPLIFVSGILFNIYKLKRE